MLPWTDSPGCASWRPAWDSPPASLRRFPKRLNKRYARRGIRAERIRADTGFEAAGPFPAAGGISLPCLRLPPPRVSGQGAPFPQSPAPPESSFRPLGSLSNLFDEPDILQKSAREYAGSFVLPPCIISLDVV